MPHLVLARLLGSSTTVLCVLAVLASGNFSEACVADETFGNDTSSNYAVWMHLLRFCAASYGTGQELENWSCGVCKKELSKFQMEAIVTDEKYETLALVGFDPSLGQSGSIVVALRGTDTLLNWVQDFDVIKMIPRVLGRKLKDQNDSSIEKVVGEVHSGFMTDYLSLRPQIISAVKAIRQRSSALAAAPIHVTGHSLGAALASLSVLDLQIEFEDETRPPQLSMVNFGSPRVGTPQWVKFYASHVCRSLRIVHVHDIVTDVPFESFGFEHDPRKYVDPKDSINPYVSHSNYLGVSITYPDRVLAVVLAAQKLIANKITVMAV